MSIYLEIKNLAEDAAIEVGRRLTEVQSQHLDLQVSFKSPTDLVTEVDVWAEQEVSKRINESFPDHQILGEESVDKVATITERADEFSEGFCWIIDPVDGTTNFVSGIPHASISIGVTENGQRVVGVVYDPFRDEMFSAIRGEGATLNGQKIEVTKQRELRKSVVATGYPYSRVRDWPKLKPVYDLFFEQSRDMRTFGSACIDQCWVACGRLDGYFEAGIKPWDVAAGSLIVEEAGGKVSNPIDEKAQFSSFASTFLFAGPELFERLSEEFDNFLKNT